MKDYCVGFQSDSAVEPGEEIRLVASLQNAFFVRDLCLPPENGARIIRITADGHPREAKLGTMKTSPALWRMRLDREFLARETLTITIGGLRPAAVVRVAAVGPLATIGEIERYENNLLQG